MFIYNKIVKLNSGIELLNIIKEETNNTLTLYIRTKKESEFKTKTI